MAQVSTKIVRYGKSWAADSTDLNIEMSMIRTYRGGKEGLPYHYEQMRRILWPHLDDHRWHRLCRDEILRPKTGNSKITVIAGSASSGKTHEAAWIRLCEYFIWPEETCVLVSSTTIQGLKKRIWAEMTMLWEQALSKYPSLPGHLLDSSIAITTDDLEDVGVGQRKVRDMRKGIFGIANVVGGKVVGISRYCGIKQKRMRLIADEAQACPGAFLSAFANLTNNVDFEAEILGNPNDPLDPLGRAAEPREGWTDAYLEPGKTSVWDTRFLNGRCINLIGTDSPNFDFPEDRPTKYPYLISREKIADTLSFFAKDSIEYYSQCVGSMKIGTMARRVLNRADCIRFGAFTDAVWRGDSPLTNIAFLDAAYGGDRCVLTTSSFGADVEGKQVLRINVQTIVPVLVRSDISPEDQIAVYSKEYCEARNIPPENFFHDSTGRGTLGTALARIWSNKCNPVEFGGMPTKRPASLDLYWTDPRDGQRKLKASCDHYSKFVTELWWSVRYCIESQQLRNLPTDAMEEGALRQWDKVKGDKIEIESKQDMKERVGRSPDLFDSIAGNVEGARQRGFQISKLGVKEQKPIIHAIDKQAENYARMLKKRTELAAIG